MIKKDITYTNFDDELVTEPFYFSLTKFEWLELEAYAKGGLIKNLQSALDTNNDKKTIDLLKRIILRAYGEKDPDTGKFKKSDDLSIDFSKTEAFSVLFYELAYDERSSQEFFVNLIPKEMREEAIKAMNEKPAELVQLPGVTQPETNNQ